MALEEQIKTVLREACTHGPCRVEDALVILREEIPGVTFPRVVERRDANGNVTGLDVSFFDEIHDPSVRSVAVEM